METDGGPVLTASRDALMRYHGGEILPEPPAREENLGGDSVAGAGQTVRGYACLFRTQLEEVIRCELFTDVVVLKQAIRRASKFKGDQGV